LTSRPLANKNIQRFATAIFLAWVAVFILLFYYTLNFNWFISVADSLITNGLLALACIILSNMLGYYQPKNETIVFVLALTFIMALFITLMSKFLLFFLFSDQSTYINFLKFSLTVRFLILFVFISLVCPG
jgi:two-component system LytT family sensor kinase